MPLPFLVTTAVSPAPGRGSPGHIVATTQTHGPAAPIDGIPASGGFIASPARDGPIASGIAYCVAAGNGSIANVIAPCIASSIAYGVAIIDGAVRGLVDRHIVVGDIRVCNVRTHVSGPGSRASRCWIIPGEVLAPGCRSAQGTGTISELRLQTLILVSQG